MSVNLSARQFAESGLIADVATILDHAGLDPASLELEITESVVMDQSEASIERLHGLRALGVQLALDDFGTGYSSLSLPAAAAARHDQGGPLVRVRAWARTPRRQADRPGGHLAGPRPGHRGRRGGDRDRRAGWRRCASSRCDRGQGYLFSRPLPEASMEALLAAGGGRVVLDGS